METGVEELRREFDFSRGLLLSGHGSSWLAGMWHVITVKNCNATAAQLKFESKCGTL
ncbi:hypothetical protein TorRG33x02_193200 [Trema orientale]|uniref:Uncharacterized protein n=1 Tax=Trema orientale TaxID=63057 RepID=A0A2P5EHB6_TREOI|nr:hypothetical protein TorRG33x02_193200 [Trema orientale]